MANNINKDLIGLTLPSGETVLGNKWTIASPKGNIVIMEGMKEHAFRYDEFAKFLNKNGYSVYALDYFGQGLNVNKDMTNRCSWPVDGYAKMCLANNILINEISKIAPTFIFSHSMGAFMAQRYIELYPNSVSKVVLCGAGSKNPALGIGNFLSIITTPKTSSEHKAVLMDKMMFGGFNKRIDNPKTPCDWLSYNTDNVDKYLADPLCGFETKKGFVREFIKGMRALYKGKNLKRINKNIAIFIIAGVDDPVSNYGKAPAAITKMFAKYGIKNVESIVYANARHEILNEDIKEKVFSDVLNFFNK